LIKIEGLAQFKNQNISKIIKAFKLLIFPIFPKIIGYLNLTNIFESLDLNKIIRKG